MKMLRKIVLIIVVLLMALLYSACSEEAPTAEPATDTPLPPTETIVPATATPVPPTETAIPPTDTPIPSTATSLPPTEAPETVEELPATEPDMALWSKMANIPTARMAASSVEVDDKIYVLGGLGAPGVSSVVEMYDPESDAWTALAPMPTGRGAFATAVLDGKIYALGGNAGPGQFGETLDAAEMYDPESDTWTAIAKLPEPRDVLAAVALDGMIYAIGGSLVTGSESWESFRNLWIYDPLLDTWSEGPQMHRPNYGFSAVVIDGKIYAAGGGVPYVEMYDPTVGEWTKLAGPPMSKYSPGVVAMNDSIYLLGGIEGYASSVHSTNTVYVYDVAEDSWTVAAPMPTDNFGFAAAVVDDSIYLAGGAPVKTYSPRYPTPKSSHWAYTP